VEILPQKCFPNKKEFVMYGLTRENFPYLLTIIIAIIGFQLNYLIHTTVESPIVEYELKKVHEKSEAGQAISNYECEITNITNTTSFKNIEIHFLFPEGTNAAILDPSFQVIPPSSLYNVGMNTLNDRIVEFTIDRLQPGFKYLLTFTTKMKEGENHLPNIYLQSANAIKIKPKSLLTTLVEHQSFVNSIILAMLIILVVLYIPIILKKKEPSSDE
jgi:hypothetical protein